MSDTRQDYRQAERESQRELRPIPAARGTREWTLNNGEVVRGCRDLGCYSAALGDFCWVHAAHYEPHTCRFVSFTQTDGTDVTACRDCGREDA